MVGKLVKAQFIHGRLHSSLAPKSKRPRKVRVSSTDPRIIQEIIRLRTEHRTLGKAKLCIILKPFCEANGLKMISEIWIGRIIILKLLQQVKLTLM
jgi:hypothetical protein